MGIRYSICLDCGSKETAKILYGMPTHDVKPQVDRGEVVLGGCTLPVTPKEYHCKDCGHEWSKEEAVDDAYQKIERIKASVGGYFGDSYEIDWDVRTGEVTHSHWENSYGEDPATTNAVTGHSFESIKGTNLLRWKKDYQPEETTLDGTSWGVEIVAEKKVIRKHGSNAYPKTWEQFCELMEEVSGKTFR